VLSGSARAKDACRMLMKLTSGVKFINILQAAFVPIFLHQKITKPNQTVTREKLRKKRLHKKVQSKMLMKLTSGVKFINILQVAFVPIFLRQKITKPNQTVTREKLRKRLLHKKSPE